jgi:hypothetical protein
VKRAVIVACLAACGGNPDPCDSATGTCLAIEWWMP